MQEYKNIRRILKMEIIPAAVSMNSKKAAINTTLQIMVHWSQPAVADRFAPPGVSNPSVSL
jgi:hypothetical protein